jgi:uncharacterized protein
MEHELLSQEIRAFVNKTKLGFVATVCADGTPNLSPKGTTIAWDGYHLAFADIHSPGTIANLLVNPSIEVNVVDVFTRKGYRFKGMGEVHSEGRIFEDIVHHFKDAGLKHAIKNIVSIRVDSVIPVISPAYDNDASETEITDRWINYWQSIHTNK